MAKDIEAKRAARQEKQAARQARQVKEQETAYILSKFMVDRRATRRTPGVFARTWMEENPLPTDGKQRRIKMRFQRRLERRRLKAEAKGYLRRVDAGVQDIKTTLSGSQIEKLQKIRGEVTLHEEETIEQKRKKERGFTFPDRALLSVETVFNRLPKEEKKAMFRAAHYEEEDIPVDIGKRAGKAAKAAGLVLAGEWAARAVIGVTGAFDSIAEKIPSGYTVLATTAAIVGYTAAYAIYLGENLRWHRKFKKSANPLVTTVDASAKHLVSDRASDAIAIATAVGIDAFFSTLLYTGALGVFGESGRIITAATTLALINLVLAASGEAALQVKMRREIRRTQGQGTNEK